MDICVSLVLFFFYMLPNEFHVIISIENGGGCLYLSGVKISDLVPFTVSQTLVDYDDFNNLTLASGAYR